MSIRQGNKFKNNPCIIQSFAYYAAATNKPKKLRRTFKASFNTFLNPVSSVYNPKVINFARYKQRVNAVWQKSYCQRISFETPVYKRTYKVRLDTNNFTGKKKRIYLSTQLTAYHHHQGIFKEKREIKK